MRAYLMFVLAAVFAAFAINEVKAVSYPLKVGPGGHYLVDQNNSPVFIHGDSPWSLIAQLNIADAETYVSNRASLQVNAMIVNLIEHKFSDHAPTNFYGVAPFTKKINGTAYWDYSSINPDYFTNADNVIRMCGKYGVTVFLDPDFLGVNGGAAGWYSDMSQNSSNTLYAFGQYIGKRYASFPNIVWQQAGDYTSGNAQGVIQAVAKGIASADPNHIQLAEGFQSPGFSFSGAWNVVNTVYEYGIYHIPSDTYYQYNPSPTSPTLLDESNYEGEDNSGMGHLATAHDCRNQAYFSALSGSCGEFYGNHWIWQFISGWQSQQFTLTSMTLTNLPRLFASRPWYSYVPDTGHTVVTSGYGTLDQLTYCPVLVHSSGATIMAYIPGNSGAAVTLSVNMTKLSGTTANAWWYDPIYGNATSIGSFPTTGTRNFTSPDSGEWVLVIDDSSQNYGAPGIASAGSPQISSFSASPTTISSGGSSTLSWSVSGNPAPTVSITPGIGTVTGSSVVVSPGATITYTLTASNSGGTASAQRNVIVSANSDTTPPSVPTNLTNTFSSTTQLNLAWTASTDNLGVAGYRIFRNGVQIATSSGAFYSDTGLTPSTTYSYAVSAFDAAGNSSAQCAPVSATTQAAVTSTPAMVQTAGNTDSIFGTSIAQSFSSANTPGNLIVALISWGNSTASPTVTDSAGNTYTLAISTYNSSGDQSQAIYYAKNIKAGANTVTVNFGGSHNWRRILIAEYRGLDPVNPVDGVVANQGSASTAKDNATSTAITTTSNGDLIFGAAANFNAHGSASAGTGFTLRSFLIYNGVIETAVEDRIQSSAGSAAATFTFSTADSYVAQMVAFRAATSGQSAVAPTVSSFTATPSTIASGSSSTLSWSVSGNPAPTVSISPGIGTVTGQSVVVSPNTTTTYTLTASSGSGTSSAQTVVTVNAPNDSTPPSIPTNVNAAAASASQINLTWIGSTDNVGVAGYRVFRNGAQVGTSSGTSYSDTSLSASTTYTYTVSAFDAAGNSSAQCAPVSATTQGAAATTTPAMVQTAGNTDSIFATSIAQSFSSTNTSGNLIVVLISCGNSTASPTVTDSAGNTYTLAISTYNSSGDQYQAIYYAKNIKAGINTVTVNFGGSHNWRRILIAEYRGLDPVNPLDGVVANQESASTAKDNATSTALTTISNGDLIFGAAANFNARGNVSAGTGFTLRSFLIYNSVIETAVEDKIQSSAGPAAATFTFSTADSYIAQTVAFRAAGQ